MSLDASQADQLAAFGTLIEKWNKAINLVSRADVARLDARHLIDSLAASPLLTGKTVLDVGTGPGLPGIPLAIAEPAKFFTLWERMSRRVRFSQMACRELGLTNIEVVECDLAKTSDLQPMSFDHIVARAVAPMAELWPALRGHLAKHGSLIVYSHTSPQSLAIPENDAAERQAPAAESLHQTTPQGQMQMPQLQQITYGVPGLDTNHHLQLVSNSSLAG